MTLQAIVAFGVQAVLSVFAVIAAIGVGLVLALFVALAIISGLAWSLAQRFAWPR